MQMTIDTNIRPAQAIHFARRRGHDYMMRSEKRSGYGSGQTPPNPNPRRRRRRRAGFFYILLTLLLSVVLWPVGMLMLWRRKVRWHATTKLLTSIVTLVLCLTLLTFGLTVQTENARFTRIQDSVNDFLNGSVEAVGNVFHYIMNQGDQLWAGTADLSSAIGDASVRATADTLELAAEYGAVAREYLIGLFGADESVDESEAGSESSDATATDAPATNAPATKAPATGKPATEPTGKPEASVQPTDVTAEPTVESTTEPVSTPEIPGEGELPLTVPGNVPEGAEATEIGNGTLGRDGTFATVEPTAEPTAEPTEAASGEGIVAVTPAPTETPDLTPKAAGEAIVYYNPTGTYFHLKNTCTAMPNADEHTLAEAVAEGKKRCNRCLSFDPDILEAENVVWTDDAKLLHLSNECEAFSGSWSLMIVENALAEHSPCTFCMADQYVLLCGLELPEPTATPAPTATPVPEPVEVTPTATVKPAAEAMLYHSSNGGWYHTYATCSGMGGASLYSLSDCVKDGFRNCRACSAPLPGLLKELCLWQDAGEVCHTSDECPAFEGKWTLVIRDEALESGCTGCKVCGADEYLVPNTIIKTAE